MTQQITDKMYMGEPFKDDRPLTDETLQELGFDDKGIYKIDYLLTLSAYSNEDKNNSYRVDFEYNGYYLIFLPLLSPPER